MNLISGILAGALALAGGLGVSGLSEEDTAKEESVIQEQRIENNQITDMMDADEVENMELVMEDNVINFGQMKSHISEMHPEWTNQQLKEHYKAMHGTGGSSLSSNFKGMGSMHQ